MFISDGMFPDPVILWILSICPPMEMETSTLICQMKPPRQQVMPWPSDRWHPHSHLWSPGQPITIYLLTEASQLTTLLLWWRISGKLLPRASPILIMESRTAQGRMVRLVSITAISSDTTTTTTTWGEDRNWDLWATGWCFRKSASVQIIAHEPSRCEGCFDGRLPLLLIVVFIAVVLFLLCIGVILDAEGNNFPLSLTCSTTRAWLESPSFHETRSDACLLQQIPCLDLIKPARNCSIFSLSLNEFLLQCSLEKIWRRALWKCIRLQVWYYKMFDIEWFNLFAEPSVACQKLDCSLGAVCRVDEDDVATCQCEFQCSKSVKSVCGSDGLTYDNDCQRLSAQCKLQTKIELVSAGACVKDPCENVECPPNQECLASFDGASARCACKGPCPQPDQPPALVCGSDGQDYPSLCHLGDVQQITSTLPSRNSLAINTAPALRC